MLMHRDEPASQPIARDVPAYLIRSGTPTATSTGDVTTWTRDLASGVLLTQEGVRGEWH